MPSEHGPMAPLNATTTGSDSSELGLASTESVTITVPEDQSRKNKEKESDVEDCPITPSMTVDDYPDGGFAAWCVALGATCAIFATFGLLNSWGVFQSYYQRVLIPETRTSTIAWIGSIQYALIFLPGLVAGRLCDLGYYNRTLLISSVILVVATVLTAECRRFWQLLLCQGLLIGICCGMIFSPIPVVISQWFEKRRSFVIGTTSAGAALGGITIPIAARNLINLVGFKWTMRIIALIELVMLAIANVTLKRRIEPSKQTGPFFAWHDFRNPAFIAFISSGIFAYLGLYTVLTFIDLGATRVGISPGFSFYLVSIANAGSGFGRILGGFLGDKYGAITVTGPSTVLCAAMTYLWPFVTTKDGLVAIALIYGSCCGTYVALLATPVIMMGDIRDSGRRSGTAWTCLAFGAIVGPPISGAIAQGTGGFKAVGYYAGSCIIVSVALLYLTKYLMIGNLRGKC